MKEYYIMFVWDIIEFNLIQMSDVEVTFPIGIKRNKALKRDDKFKTLGNTLIFVLDN